jgi:nitrite reductase/ring-hydroxylating ferredoxin subunit/uncharacterized membrane protein
MMERGLRRIPAAIGGLISLDRLAGPIAEAASRLTRPRPLKDLLSGTWLGHPVHPVLTDATIGAWSAAWLLDLVPGERAKDLADAFVGLGILSALPTAATGLSDWAETHGEDRRIGLAHGAGNVTALLVYAGSLAARRRGRRGLGVALSWAGIGLATFTAYLGGHLVYGKGVGVDRNVQPGLPTAWRRALDEGELPDGVPTLARVDGAGVLLYRTGGRILAVGDRCSHRGCSLARGRVHDEPGEPVVECQCHGSTFRLSDGSVVHGPATSPQPDMEARVQDGNVLVRLTP